jgi:hypothetical protein
MSFLELIGLKKTSASSTATVKPAAAPAASPKPMAAAKRNPERVAIARATEFSHLTAHVPGAKPVAARTEKTDARADKAGRHSELIAAAKLMAQHTPVSAAQAAEERAASESAEAARLARQVLSARPGGRVCVTAADAKAARAAEQAARARAARESAEAKRLAAQITAAARKGVR